MRVEDFDFVLPPELIAQTALEPRDAARLFVLGERMTHEHVRDLPALLAPGSLLIVNDTRVIRARLFGKKPSGGQIELLLIERIVRDDDGETWRCMSRASKPMRLGAITLEGDGAPPAEVIEVEGGGHVRVRFLTGAQSMFDITERIGHVPLPPYIARATDDPSDVARYQTVFANAPGSVAAPTAGLHFTPQLLQRLQDHGIERASVTLHVGPGTFLPLRHKNIADNRLHPEHYSITKSTAEKIAAAKREGRPVVAVGTTVVRTLEAAAAKDGALAAGQGTTDIFIHPGHRFAVVDRLMTNFHLPQSSLLMLVCAFAGKDRALAAYAAAVRERYRFYSYGDAMLIEPQR